MMNTGAKYKVINIYFNISLRNWRISGIIRGCDGHKHSPTLVPAPGSVREVKETYITTMPNKQSI